MPSEDRAGAAVASGSHAAVLHGVLAFVVPAILWVIGTSLRSEFFGKAFVIAMPVVGALHCWLAFRSAGRARYARAFDASLGGQGATACGLALAVLGVVGLPVLIYTVVVVVALWRVGH